MLSAVPPKAAFDINNDTTTGDYFVAADGHKVYYNIWKPAGPVVAIVLAFHGLGEHIHRYEHVFSRFAEAGILVKGMDYRGHGRTMKKNPEFPAGFSPIQKIWDDMLILDAIEVKGVPAGLPKFVMGHSLGGLLALGMVHFMGKHLTNLRGVIAQAPAHKPGNPPAAALVFVVKAIGNFVPKITQPNELILSNICTSPQVLEAYMADPLVHGEISFKLAKDIFDFADKLDAQASTFNLPVLTYFAEQDKMTDFKAGKAWHEKCGSTDKTFKAIPDLFHELHNEPAIKDELISDYVNWIKKRATTEEAKLA
ncbi:hypothetical protein HDV05_006747 [Chytridiales sp. JEL 0842]|nr:hypothetical protein HDV05_006747 [Chytridiales sp. JEL 0842]